MVQGAAQLMRVCTDISTDADRYPFRHTVRVRFGETDAMGIAHHSAYVLWLEEARVEYLRALGHPYSRIREAGYDFTVLEVLTQYRRPARFEDQVQVATRISAARGATFQIDYLATIAGEISLVGATVHGVVDAEGRAARMPGWMRDLLVVS